MQPTCFEGRASGLVMIKGSGRASKGYILRGGIYSSIGKLTGSSMVLEMDGGECGALREGGGKSSSFGQC
jgi:hypothetical protein